MTFINPVAKITMIGWIYFLFFSSMIHGDPTCWNEKNEHSEERRNGKKMMKKKRETLNQ
jgi:hypothetical protein